MNLPKDKVETLGIDGEIFIIKETSGYNFNFIVCSIFQKNEQWGVFYRIFVTEFIGVSILDFLTQFSPLIEWYDDEQSARKRYEELKGKHEPA